MTVIAPESAEALDALMEGEVECAIGDCKSPAVVYVRYPCKHAGEMCAAHRRDLEANIAACLEGRKCLECPQDGKRMTPDDITIRPI